MAILRKCSRDGLDVGRGSDRYVGCLTSKVPLWALWALRGHGVCIWRNHTSADIRSRSSDAASAEICLGHSVDFRKRGTAPATPDVSFRVFGEE